MKHVAVFAVLCVCMMCSAVVSAEQSPYAKWSNGPSTDPSFFPIAVWLQDPADAARYKEAGINVYVGLWKGPTGEQLDALAAAGMKTVCHQNETGLSYSDTSLIIGWMHGDEPDNAQRPVIDGVWSPPVLPKKIQADYHGIKNNDSTRPVFLNLGQGVAWNNYIGRGVRRNCPQDYPQYAKGADIVSFDIYPVAHSNAEVKNKLWMVSRGVERLRRWTDYKKPVWNCIETTRINSNQRISPRQLRAEVWMSVIHGSGGIIYFVHEWKPETDTRRLLNDAEMLEAVTMVNRQIHELAPVVNSAPCYYCTEVMTSNAHVPVDVSTRHHEGDVYVFASAMRPGKTAVSFFTAGTGDTATAEVIGENRSIDVANGRFKDVFEDWDVHLYRITPHE